MSDSTAVSHNEPLTFDGDPVAAIATELAAEPWSGDRCRSAEAGLIAMAEAAREADRVDIAEAASLLGAVLGFVASAEGHAEGQSSGELDEAVAFVRDRFSIVQDAWQTDGTNGLAELIGETRHRFEDWITVIDERRPVEVQDTSSWDADWDELSLEDGDCNDENAQQQIAALLAAVSEPGSDGSGPVASETPVAPATPTPPAKDDSNRSSPNDIPDDSPDVTTIVDLDQELLEAFLDDAQRCLASMEEAAIAFESNPGDVASVKQICRELHTIKGASASVGMEELASYVHQAEDHLQAGIAGEGAGLSADFILTTVDEVRRRIGQITPSTSAGSPNEPQSIENRESTAPAARFDETFASSEETVRVNAAQLHRLLDLLAQLVMLRNRRDSRVGHLKTIQTELVGCTHRLHRFVPVTGSQGDGEPEAGSSVSNPAGELVSDIMELARQLRDLYEPVSEENQAISHLIGQFRQELVQLSRVPVGGLFRRLQRALRDAARTEQKRVRVVCRGEETGIDRSLQERLYEPLLHVVRNAVCHGIESESQRRSAGKPEEGTITLSARGNAHLLILEVQDDGGGLDYDAIRRRARERGLLAADRPATRDELAQLIFHPGFSTRQQAGAAAGRGVGMDVVAVTLEQLRGWVEVDSTPGQGTTVRLTVPLRSTIEHTMVFRVGSQLFGLPLQWVHRAVDGPSQMANLDSATSEAVTRAVPFASLIGTYDDGTEGAVLVLEQAATTMTGDRPTGTSIRPAWRVDEILGPEEVVVRPLPALLRHHPFLTGATLSGTGDTMLLLDGAPLVHRTTARDAHTPRYSRESGPLDPSRSCLVVDDSLSARLHLVRLLEQYGWTTVACADGREALSQLRSQEFSAVFTDLDMPHLDGWGVLREIRNETRHNGLPVIVVSSRKAEECGEKALASGASAYLVKPVDASRLVETLAKLSLCAVDT